jgi:hypothetical protein
MLARQSELYQSPIDMPHRNRKLNGSKFQDTLERIEDLRLPLVRSAIDHHVHRLLGDEHEFVD